jgi:hypothetical protein
MRSKWCACAAVRQLIKAGYSNWWNEKTSIILSRKIAGAPGVRRLPPHTRHRPIVAHLADARPEQPRFSGSSGAAAASGVDDYWALILQSWVFLAMAAGTLPLILVAVLLSAAPPMPRATPLPAKLCRASIPADAVRPRPAWPRPVCLRHSAMRRWQ